MKYYQLAGMKALNANKDNFLKAQAMKKAGCSADEIWKEAGFFFDADNKWKWEIPDTNAKHPIKLQENWKEAVYSETPYLDEVISHPTLFENYPQLRTMYVTPKKYDRDSIHGSYSLRDAEISLNMDSIGDDLTEVLSTLNHEVAHAIQDIEGFSNGYSNEKENKDALLRYIDKLDNLSDAEIHDFRFRNSSTFIERNRAYVELERARLFKSFSKLIDYAHSDKPTRVLRHIKEELSWVYYEPFTGENGKMSEEARDLDRMWYDLPKSDRKGMRTSHLRDMCMAGAQMIRDAIPPSDFRRFKESDRKIDSIIKSQWRIINKCSTKLYGLQELEDSKRRILDFKEDIKWVTPYDIYHRVGGEVAARTVQARMLLPEDVLAERIPTADYDVPLNKVIPIVEGRILGVDPYAEKDLLEATANASIEFGGQSFAKMVLNPTADASSLVHESAHYYLEVFSGLNQKEGVNQEIKEDFKQILDWMGLTEQQWYSLSDEKKEPYHERFAEAFEHFLMTNESPLSNVFSKMKTWLNDIYSKLTGVELQTSEGLEGVFGKIIKPKAGGTGAFSESIYNAIEVDISSEVAAATKEMHDVSMNYFSNASGIPVEKITNRFDLEITSSQPTAKMDNSVKNKMR